MLMLSWSRGYLDLCFELFEQYRVEKKLTEDTQLSVK